MKQISKNKEEKRVYKTPSLIVVELDNTNVLAASQLYPGTGDPE
jgi:hypothetical protein